MTLIEDVKSIVAIKTTELGAIASALIDSIVEEIQFVILDYCNINTIPVALKYTWANMVEDQLRYYVALAKQGTQDADATCAIDMGDVSQLKIGDTTIQLDASKNTTQSTKALKAHTANLDNLVRDYKQQLNKHRRMVW